MVIHCYMFYISLRYTSKQRRLKAIIPPFTCHTIFGLRCYLIFYFILFKYFHHHASAIVDICLLASGSLVSYYCAIWCSSCTGKVFLCGASRQPPSLWNCFSNILFKVLTGHISTAHSSPAASRDSSKWSKTPQWHPVFFFVIERPLCLRGVEGVEAEWQRSCQYLKWTCTFSGGLWCPDQLDLIKFLHPSIPTIQEEILLFM